MTSSTIRYYLSIQEGISVRIPAEDVFSFAASKLEISIEYTFGVYGIYYTDNSTHP